TFIPGPGPTSTPGPEPTPVPTSPPSGVCTPGACVDSCHRCTSDGQSTGLDYSCSSDWCACARAYNSPSGWENSCGGGSAPAPKPGCVSFNQNNCRCDCWGDHGCGGPSFNPTYCRPSEMFQIRQCFDLSNNTLGCNVPGSGMDRCDPRPNECCSCSWVSRGCSQSCGNGTQRLEVYKCNDDLKCGGGITQCKADASCCTCGGWTNGACGSAGGCPVGQRRQTRSCSPSGCASQSQCVADAACNPSCTISLSPSSLSLKTGNSQPLTANVNFQNSSVSRVDFSSGNSAIASVNPASSGSSPYNTNVYGNNVGSTTIAAQAVLSPSGSCSTSAPVSVEAKAWFQTQGGDVHAQGRISDRIPSFFFGLK
ncbi:MAG: Ig-like domain-containing protein, partial [Candidatus Humimicrobiaceae bacterium]